MNRIDEDPRMKEKSRFGDEYEKLKLNGVPLKNARVLNIEDGLFLESFYTIAAGITKDKWLFILGLYSADTTKHIQAFVEQYTNIPFEIAKQAYKNNQAINIETGELKTFDI